MATPVFACGFECGVSASAGSHVGNISSGVTFDTTTKRSGARSLRIQGSSSAIRYAPLTNNYPGTVQRFYIYVSTVPSSDWMIHEVRRFTDVGTGATYACGIAYKASDGKVYAAMMNTGTGAWTWGSTGVTPSTGTWLRIDDRCTLVGGQNVTVAQVDGTAVADLAYTPAGSTTWYASALLGDNVHTVTNVDIYYDDLLGSNTSGDYPLGGGYIKSYIPNSDGTHNIAGSADFYEGTNATPKLNDIYNGGSPLSDVYTYLDERPLPNTSVDFVNIVAPPNATDYVEWQYEHSSESVAPRFVEATWVFHDAGGAGTETFFISLRENTSGSYANIHPGGAYNVGATLTYERVGLAVAPSNNAWTTALFNDLRSRLSATDASPDIYLDGIMLEVEFAEVGGDVTLGINSTNANATGAAGSVGQTRDRAIDSTSASASGAVGTLTPSITYEAALTTVLATGAVQSLGRSTDRAVSTVLATGAVQAPAPATARGITAEGAATATSALAVAASVAVGSPAVQGNVGAATASVAVALAGPTAAAGALGDVVPTQAVLVAIDGIAASGAVGSLGLGAREFTLSTVLATSEVGTVTASVGGNVTVSASGVSGAAEVGNLALGTRSFVVGGVGATAAVQGIGVERTRTLSGPLATGAVQAVGSTRTVAVTGALVTGAVGTVTTGADVTVAVAGQSATVSVGSLAPSAEAVISGAQAGVVVGTAAPATTVIVSGNALTTDTGTITTVGGESALRTGTVEVGDLAAHTATVGDVVAHTVAVGDLGASALLGTALAESVAVGESAAGTLILGDEVVEA